MILNSISSFLPPPRPIPWYIIRRIASLPFLWGRGRFRRGNQGNFFMDAACE